MVNLLGLGVALHPQFTAVRGGRWLWFLVVELNVAGVGGDWLSGGGKLEDDESVGMPRSMILVHRSLP